MSDFDREAEREKLREQFAEDEQRRESTERMSELLLQGATMTNKHCDTCGDPIFRYDDQEFCPSCQGDRQEATDQSVDQPALEQQPADSHPVQPTRSSSDTEQGAPDSGQREEAMRKGRDVEQTQQGTDVDRSDQPAPEPQTPSHAVGRDEIEGTRAPTGTGNLGEARGALSRTVTRLARQAETSDDLGRTREYLQAATEAAEALAAVKQADR